MSEIGRKIVDEIEAGQLEKAKETIHQGIKEKAAEVVDMKRVEASVDWLNKESPQEKEGEA
jgi:hypothetical protein|tara:strand:- start:678 stop:860 length:183 start_codon:yes stop_codon:yes gene_type:complete